jgi:hypothetical protein
MINENAVIPAQAGIPYEEERILIMRFLPTQE